MGQVSDIILMIQVVSDIEPYIFIVVLLSHWDNELKLSCSVHHVNYYLKVSM